MAWETGTSTSPDDLLSKLRTFATANGLTEIRYATGLTDTDGTTAVELVLKGTGFGVQDVYFAMRSYNKPAVPTYGWFLNCLSAYNTGTAFNSQTGGISASPLPVTLPLDSSSFTYWFIVNQRNIKVIAKIGSRYLQMYLGYPSMYVLATTYPLAFIVGGSGVSETDGSGYGRGIPYSTSSDLIRAYWNPNTNYNFYFTQFIYRLGGIYSGYTGAFQNQQASAGLAVNRQLWPYCVTQNNDIFKNMTVDFNGCYDLMAIKLMDSFPDGTINNYIEGLNYYEMEGVSYVSGQGMSAETLVNYGGSDWICFPNVYRTGNSEWAAYKLA